MSAGNNARSQAPFGYTFEVPNPPNNSSYPAPGPPLLDNNESDLLENFFENPNNVDPSFLSASPNFSGDPSSLFAGASALDWLSHGINLSNSTEAPTRRSISQPTLQRVDQTGFAARGSHSNSVPASDEDVYAAARLLHNNQVGRLNNMSGQYNGYSNMGGTGHDISPSNGFGYPPIPSPHSAPYNFDTASANTNPYNMSTFPSQYNNMEQASGRNIDGRVAAVRFGSDSNFRNNYSGLRDSNEKDSMDSFNQLYNVAREQAALADEIKPDADQGQRKRTRGQVGNTNTQGDQAEAENVDEENKAAKKRRKSKAKDEEAEDDVDTYDDQSINGRRKSSSAQTKARTPKTATSLTSEARKKSSPGGSASKALRENLSEEQKRSNHIQSEQKRRNLIKQGFDDLVRMVPELRAGGFSKSNMLVEAAKFMRRLQDENEDLKAHVRSLDHG